MEKGIRLPNSVMMKPLTYLFANEYEGGKFRKYMTEKGLDKAYKYNIKKVLLDTMEYYREINPEALYTVNGEKVIRPSSHYLSSTTQ